MDEDRMLRTEQILAKTSELRSKIINAIQKASNESEAKGSKESPDEKNHEEEAKNLLNIKDVLESIERQLSSLQALHHKQWYEKELALAQIEYNRRKLLEEVKTYKGNNLEAIKEVITFASEPFPPYPSWPFAQTGLKNLYWTSKNRQKSGPFKGVKDLLITAAKTALSVVGLITILNLAGYETRLTKQDNRIRVMNVFKLQDDEGSRDECPSGKVAVIENGEFRCVVKARVEVPFESVVDSPDVGYGCG